MGCGRGYYVTEARTSYFPYPATPFSVRCAETKHCHGDGLPGFYATREAAEAAIAALKKGGK